MASPDRSSARAAAEREAERKKERGAKRTQAARAREAVPGTEVSGELLSGEVEAKPETVALSKRVAARTGTPQSAGAGGGDIPTAAWGIGAVVALLAGGALVEAGAFTDLIPRLRERRR